MGVLHHAAWRRLGRQRSRLRPHGEHLRTITALLLLCDAALSVPCQAACAADGPIPTRVWRRLALQLLCLLLLMVLMWALQAGG